MDYASLRYWGMVSQFELVMEDHGRLVEDELKRTFTAMTEEGDEYHQLIGDVYKALQGYCLRGGKRIAASSTLMAYQGYSGKLDDDIVKVACGIEFYRHCILVHDDLVDRDDLRRGEATLHRLMGRGKDNRFGEGIAVFAGNMLCSLAIKTMLSAGFPSHLLVKAVDMLCREFRRVNESQALDLLFEYTDPDPEEWEVMASRRAASLFVATMGVGAILGGASESERAKISEAAEHIGFAFDIQDDIIDTFADEERYGRSPCGDLVKGKKPLHVVLAMRKDKEFRSLMSSCQTGGEFDAEEVRALIRRSGALEEAKRVSQAHASLAKGILLDTEMGPESKSYFLSLIDFITESLSWYE
jgi:geranylgeranyl diphosphate synthase, type I